MAGSQRKSLEEELSAIPFKFPINGVTRAFSATDHPKSCAVDASNVTTWDSKARRLRGAARTGTKKFIDAQVDDSNPILFGSSFAVDIKKLTYAEQTPVARWKYVSPRKSDVTNCAVDGYANQWWIDAGNVLVKRNTDGTLIYRLAIPVADKNHVCRALAVDSVGGIYVGVSSGGDQTKAELFRYTEEFDGTLKLQWKKNTGRYFGAITTNFFTGYLYTLENDAITWKTYLVLYGDIATTLPSERWNRNCSYPGNGLVVTDEGVIYTTHEPNPNRGLDPTNLALSPKSESFTWDDLAGIGDRKHADLDASDITTLQKDTGLGILDQVTDDGDAVAFWRDRTGFARDMLDPVSLFPTLTASSRPTYRKKGFTGDPCVNFDASKQQFMASAAGTSLKEASKDGCQQLMPGWTYVPGSKGCGYAIFAVLKPTLSATKFPIVSHFNNLTGTTDCPRILANSNNAGAATQGQIWARTTSATLFATAPSYDNANSGAIVVLVVDGGNDGVQSTDLIVNGRYAGPDPLNYANPGERNENLLRTFLGTVKGTTTAEEGTYGSFEVAKIGVLRSSTKTAVGVTTEVIQSDGLVNSSTELNKLVGWLHHKYGLQHLLPDVAAGDPVTHAYRFNPPIKPGSASALSAEMNDVKGLLIKWTSSGEATWVKSHTLGGIGYGVALGTDGSIYTVGPRDSAAAAHNSIIGRFVDTGGGVSTIWTQSIDAGVAEFVNHNPTLGVDKFNNLYIPCFLSGNATPLTVRVLDSTGATHADFATVPGSLANTLQAYAVAVDPNVPDYGADTVTEAFQYFCATTNNSTAALETMFAVAPVSVTLQDGPPRSFQAVVVAGGNLYRFDGGVLSLVGGGTLLDVNAQFVSGVWAFGELFMVDGKNNVVYSPKTGTWKTWLSKSNGSIPQRCRLICLWHNRVLLAGDPENPFQMFASRIGTAYDFDFDPPLQDERQAFDLIQTLENPAQDIINALVPIGMDVLWIGGENSILQVSGDPMAGGSSSIDEITRATGMSFGRSWGMDDNGTVYFAGSRGGVWRASLREQPARISRAREGRLSDIEERLAKVDQSINRFELIWDDINDRLCVFVIPWADPTQVVECYFWERVTGGWWPFSLPITMQATAVFQHNDPALSTKRVLFGANGYVFCFDSDAEDDDGNVIPSRVEWGPMDNDDAQKTQLRQIQVVLAEDSAPCKIKVFGLDSSDSGGDPAGSGVVNPGFSDRVQVNTAGNYITIELSNDNAKHWAFESATGYGTTEGIRRGS